MSLVNLPDTHQNLSINGGRYEILLLCTQEATRRTLSSSVSDNHIEEFKRRFRRSGSLGVPFFPEGGHDNAKVPSRFCSILQTWPKDTVLLV
ncbi:hypothetical protein L596_000161 [Steinernema carpocapsae]|uniref:Uncharacterized protein n=1 Tax=Steinernema carpocapsae TaxID=34508 RepID=A0A4U8UH19_STECR|nr:hypothetical protein L596_000161 [Steinernema carpocapsae]